MDAPQSYIERDVRDLAADQDGNAVQEEEQQRLVAYWCYQCNKEVMAEAEVGGGDGAPRGDTVCPECSSGFIETMATARALPDVRRAQRHHQRRRPPSRDDRNGNQGEHDEENDDSYQRQVLRLLRLLARSTRNIPRRSAEERQHSRGERSPQRIGEPQGQELLEPDSSFSLPAREEVREGQVDQDLQEGEVPSPSDVHDSHGINDTDAVFVRNGSFFQGEELPSLPEDHDSGLAEEEPADASEGVFVPDGSLSQEETADFEEESDSEAETRLLELGDWGSMDEDDEEWEEVEDDEDGGLDETVEEMDGQARENEDGLRARGGERTELPTREQVVEGDGQESRISNTGRSRTRPRNLHNTLHRHLQEILRNLESHNIEIRLEIPETDTYVGNPGDYLDARGYEQLLQQLLDSDNSRRGAPPAAKSAVEGLSSIIIQQKHLDDGSALCAICKDIIPIEGQAKQMPCLHLYHRDCILPWLESRNSCPVCRYELLTDDIDYEEQKCLNPQQTLHASISSEADAGDINGISNHEVENNQAFDNSEDGNQCFDYAEGGSPSNAMHGETSKNDNQ